MDQKELAATFEEGYSWEEYLLLVNKSANLHKKRYSEVKTTDFRLNSSSIPLKAVIITEEACGDCAWAVPIIIKILDNVENIEYKLFPRREFPELQDNFLTKGKRSVPKLVFLDDKLDVIGQWGPRPVEIQAYVEESVGNIGREVWYPKVLAYYRGEGQKALIDEIEVVFKDIQKAPGE